MEKALQRQIISWLKSQGAYVIKTRPGAGVPVGCPDIICLYQVHWAVIECKASASASLQPGQQATLDFLSSTNPFVYKVWPENWPAIKCQLQTDFF